MDLDGFVGQLDRFILDWSLAPRLEGNYHAFIAFLPRGTTVMCQYRLGGAFFGGKTAYFYHFGEIDIEHEYLLQLLAGFRALMET